MAPKWILPMFELRKLSRSAMRMAMERLPSVKTKDCSSNVESNVFCNSCHIPVECSAHVVIVAEHEGLLGIKAHSNNVFCIPYGISLDFFDCSLLGE